MHFLVPHDQSEAVDGGAGHGAAALHDLVQPQQLLDERDGCGAYRPHAVLAGADAGAVAQQEKQRRRPVHHAGKVRRHRVVVGRHWNVHHAQVAPQHRVRLTLGRRVVQEKVQGTAKFNCSAN